ncbi:NYN domain-containing protein [Pseudoalteromonas sp. MMG013]|uniref:LabA-like NYN domain-containing protein n=1 Tax=unclassified Pseudoalteromonas TaxID=194690 RepID=UPI001B37C8B0|nr:MULTISPECIES: NYN domain-containing protein [unclassified Pseudoalteromonas]MBQ4849662.1 NYN domain-containing protein [Pseudoalteromonas sp. MMG012]MBQ4860218.1 NYN domain-containing protein [Pseudoalteromonas sp. MMG013]
MKKIAIFVDVQNIYYTCRQSLGGNFDYNAFWAQAKEFGQIEYAYAYATYKGDDKQTQFQNILRAIGFEVKLKPYIQRQDGSKKGDWDVGITIDMMEAAKKVDEIILLSGDGDFAILLAHLRNQYQIKSTVYGATKLTANLLIESCDDFIPINSSLLLNR